jgi:hypothetical protein
VTDRKALELKTDYEHPAVKDLDLETLVGNDAAATEWAERNRDLLNVPAGADVHVEPRLDVTKLYYHKGRRKQRVRECLLKVWWQEPGPIIVGTTLALDWKTRRVRALLTSDCSAQFKM